MNKKLALIFDYLKELFPHPETELHYSTPFQLVMAVMLSAQATDKQVNKVTERLFQKVKTPDDVISL
jgi:endonuclease-3